MGAWDTQPWDNDGAADWFGDLWDAVPIVAKVHAALDGGDGEELRAALWLCESLCRVYVWPIADYDTTLAKAVAAADRLLAGGDDDGLLELWDDPDVTADVQRVRDLLAARRS